MVKFSCFHLHIHGIKPKKTVHPSIEAMAKTLQDGAHSQASTNSSRPSSSKPLLWKAPETKNINNAKNHHSNNSAPDPVECVPRSNDPKSPFMIESNGEVCHSVCLEKIHTLETGLYRGGHYIDNSTDGDTDPVFSYDDSKSDNELMVSGCRKDKKANSTNHCKNNPNSEFQVFYDLGDDDDSFFSIGDDDDSMYSIGDPAPSVKGVHEISNTPTSAELAGDSINHTLSDTPTLFFKSCSLPYITTSTLSSRKCSFKHASSKLKSSNNLHVLGRRQKEICIAESEDQLRGEHAEENHMDNSYQLFGVAKDRIMPVADNMNSVKILQGESHSDELPNKDFQIKRIKDWVINLQHYGPLEGTSESSASIDPLNGDVNTMNGMTAARMHSKVTSRMASAMRYISSLSANATAAHLANHGLLVIPFLCKFASLKVLNLSGNAIARITKGALPRGLHILNLSKNNISNIEGLRELTRLCVLDLGYNRIFQIGHGLASCSSLKELYLAGNKISELEGLHRLLKLSVLDLRFNKISTAKCLCQLANNYHSLKAISLEGNPAQKYVGDEQLKKYLLSFLPYLAYYNRQIIKTSTLKAVTGGSHW